MIMFPNRAHRRAGISRFEILVIVAIVLVLGGLALQTVQRVRFTAALKTTENRLKEVALSLHKCHDTYKRFPPAWGPFPPVAPTQWPSPPSPPVVRGTLHYWLLPFLKADATFDRGQPAATGGTPRDIWTNPDCYGQMVEAYFSPADSTAGHGIVTLAGANPWGAGCFAGNARLFGGLQKNATATVWDNRSRMASLFDGTSNVIVFATRHARCGASPGGSAWAGGNNAAGFSTFMVSGAFFASDVEDLPSTPQGYTRNPPFQVMPAENDCGPLLAQAYDRQGIQVAASDGSVRTVAPSISPATWGQACFPHAVLDPFNMGVRICR
jgi:Protein of unknown function (DUF1559)